jgi:hypothetical protein
MPRMSEFDRRVDMAASWFARNVIRDPEGGAGWGWVPDVPPNPQNTAEVVCALTHVGRPIPRKEDAIELIRREVVTHASHGDWVFRSVIDVAWRLRGLRCVSHEHGDPHIDAWAKTLVEAQDSKTGGWRLIGGADAESVTATCMAIVALLGLQTSVETESSVRAGVAMIVNAVLDSDPRARPLYASGQIVQVLARSEIMAAGGPRAERAREIALDRMVADLQGGEAGVQEEVFAREGVTDIWRHMTLPLSLCALAEARPDAVFEPVFRRALIDLLSLQECSADNVNYGGFRTSKEGFVTSYATTQALHALASINAKLNEQVNPGLAFNLLCRSAGKHHSDPQDIVTIGRHTVVMNSGGGALLLALACVAGLTIGALTIGLADHLGAVGSRLLLTLSAALLGVGAFAFASVRWPGVSNRRIAFFIFTGFTAIFLPTLFFLFA